MKPTPRKLALLMSIAGFGASLGDTVQARTDVDAYTRPVSVLSLTTRAAQEGAAVAGVRDAGFLQALSSTPLDARFGDVPKATQAEQRPRLQGDGEEQPLAGDMATTAASLADGHDSALPTLARLHESALHPVADPAIGPVVGDTSGTPVRPQDPAEHWVVNGIRVREPKGPPMSAKPWDSLSASGDGSDNARAPEGDADAEADAVAQPAASASASGLQAGGLASIVGAGLATPTEELTAYLAFHLQTFEAPTQAASADVLHDRGVEHDTAAHVDPEQRPNLDQAQAQVDDASIAAVSGVDLNLDMPQSVDLDLDLDLDRSLSAALGADVVVGRVEPPMTPAPPPRLRVDPAAQADAPARSGGESSVARSMTLSPAPRPTASDRAASMQLGDDGPAAADQAPQAVPGLRGGRVMRGLDVPLSAPDSAAALFFDAGAEQIFVASQEQQTRDALVAALRRPARLSQPAEHATVDAPPGARAEPAPAATVMHATADDAPDAGQAAAAPTPTAAAPASAAPSPLGEALVAVSEASLDQVRGGYTTDTGLQMSFGIERGVYINGNLVGPTTNITLAANGTATVSQVSGAAGASTGTVTNTGNLTLVQNGAGNAFLSGPVSAANAGTVIQNTLNDQTIKNLTSINATVNSLQLLRAQNFESSLRGAIVDSLRR